MKHRPDSSHRLVGSLTMLAIVASVVVAGAPASQAVNFPQTKIVNPNPDNWTPNVLDGQVNAIVQIGTKMYAAGQFTQVQAAGGGTIYARTNIFAFDATTGAIDTTFAPTLNNIVKALAVSPDGNLFVGGYFTSVNGEAGVNRLVKLNPTTGLRITAFSANANGQVWDIAVSGTRLLVGGRFTSIKNVARDRLAALNTTTGAVDTNVSFSITVPHTSDSVPWIYKLDVSPDGSKLVIIGNFMKVNTQSRPQVAMIDLSTTPASLAELADRSLRTRVLRLGLRHLHARRRLLPGWLVLRDRRYRGRGHRHALRHDRALEHERDGFGSPARLGRRHRWRHDLSSRRHGVRRLLGRAQSLAEQLLRGRLPRSRRGRAVRDRGPRSGERRAVLLEPGKGQRGGCVRPLRHERGALDGSRHRQGGDAPGDTQEDRLLPTGGREDAAADRPLHAAG